jgi:hypothetical protein
MTSNEALHDLARRTLIEVVGADPECSPRQVVAAVVRREPSLLPEIVRAEAWSLIGQGKIEFTAASRFKLR